MPKRQRFRARRSEDACGPGVGTCGRAWRRGPPARTTLPEVDTEPERVAGRQHDAESSSARVRRGFLVPRLCPATHWDSRLRLVFLILLLLCLCLLSGTDVPVRDASLGDAQFSSCGRGASEENDGRECPSHGKRGTEEIRAERAEPEEPSVPGQSPGTRKGRTPRCERIAARGSGGVARAVRGSRGSRAPVRRRVRG
jgi:hypothetical protein